MKKDTILKDITKETIREILRYIIKIEAKNIEFLNIEFQKIEVRKADVLVKADDKIIHIEFQNQNDKRMLYRELRYFLEIKELYPEFEVYQYVIYLGKTKLNMQSRLKEHNIDYSYEIIDMRNIPCESFFKLEKPEAVVLSILCKMDNPKQQIKEILEKLIKLSKNENEFRKYMLMLEELSTNRDLKTLIKETEMGLMDIKWEDLPSFDLGLEVGEKRGEKKGEEKGKKEGEKIGKIKSATIMVKEFNLEPIEVAKKLNIDVNDLLKELNG